MSWIGVAIGGSALVGGAAGYFGSKSSNKALKGLGLGAPLDPYGGRTPASPERLREVETQIDDILMRRSLGQDVGFDPSRRDALLRYYDIERSQADETQRADIQNYLSGAGLSRSAAAREDLMGRRDIESQRQAEKYRLGVDVEDLAAIREDKNMYSQMLQAQSHAKFGQQEAASNFDYNVWGQEQANELARRGLSLQGFQQRQEPWTQALLGAAGGAQTMSGIINPMGGGGSTSLGSMGSKSTPSVQSSGYYFTPRMTQPTNYPQYNSPALSQSLSKFGRYGGIYG